MKKYLVIQLTRPAYDNVGVLENNTNKYVKIYKELEKIAETRGETLLLNVKTAMDCVSYDAIADISTTQELTKQDREQIVELLKKFVTDAPFHTAGRKQYQLPFTVFFHKIDPYDVIEVEGEEMPKPF